MNDALLNIENLSVNYGDFIAVEDASLAVEEGQIISLIGLNGAGKTTLVSSVMGLTKQKSGKVYFDGSDISNLPTDKIVARGLSLIPQGGRCFNRMSVQDNLLMGSFPKSARKGAKEPIP